jgi:hypothetical protein
MQNKQTKVDMDKNVKYDIIVKKIVLAHQHRCECECSSIVLNLLGGLRLWTRVEFDCGERIKINCHALEKV